MDLGQAKNENFEMASADLQKKGGRTSEEKWPKSDLFYGIFFSDNKNSHVTANAIIESV